jgi:beta-glucanase (GH16 family)
MKLRCPVPGWNFTYPQYEVRGEFQAPSAGGTWPAFWLTRVRSWPPESDILEYKGDARMEGSSGTPGPTGNTYYSVRNVYVSRTHA